MLSEGSGEPLVLFHGIMGTGGLWRDVIPHLAPDFDVAAPTALGHVGGRDASVRPATFEHVFADAERSLDELRLEKAHLAGNSMGGWIALELARRGRALTVCALSPAGFWDAGSEEHVRTRNLLRRVARDAKRSRSLLPLLMRSPRMRRFGLRLNVRHGERVAAADVVRMTDDMLACTVRDDLLAAEEEFTRLDPAPCPITIAWSEFDRIFPVERYRPLAAALIPEADFVVLEGVGHVPMLDDPTLVARTIRATAMSGSS